jgi:hypothetical protein
MIDFQWIGSQQHDNCTVRTRSKNLYSFLPHHSLTPSPKIYGVVKVVTCLVFIFFLADSLGRRKSFMFGGAIQAFCMFFVGFVCDPFQLLTPTHAVSISASALSLERVIILLPRVSLLWL